ncbi:UNVERIFIED_CONTAM: Membrane proteins related to metalloendopeptidases [Acetivibrio alkalicellulosi]
MNFKKLFPDKKITQKKILDFFDKKGFFVVLGLCLVIIGGTAFFVTRNNITSSKNYGDEIITKEMADDIDEDVELSSAYLPQDDAERQSIFQPEDEEIVDTSVSANEIEAQSNSGDSNEESVLEEIIEEVPKAEIIETSKNAELVIKDEEPQTIEAAKVQRFIMPVFGDVILEFAVDKLVYSKTLNEWRAHTGVGIAADRGTPVKVVADGVVADVKNDPRLGITIIVEHSKELKTVYANLASSDMVTPNQKVKQGEVIGSVGNTATFKSADPSHLHFEVLEKNEPVDPMKFLPIPEAKSN